MKSIFVLVSSFITIVCFSQKADSSKTKTKNDRVISSHTIKINNETIKYTAETGYFAVKNEKLEAKANIYFTAYTRDGVSDASKRAITFCFNGGPGSSSIWLHLGALGPRRVQMTDSGNATLPPYQLIDNEYSWLSETDLVFIDPVGTGFSRSTKDDEEKQHYGYKNDLKSVGEFIRQYATQYKRWGSPKYLAGESYGTTRAVGLAKYLLDEHGMYLNGIILVSAALNFETLREYDGNDMANVCNLAGLSAVAWYHKKLDANLQADFKRTLQQAKDYAFGDYLKALTKGNLLTKEEEQNVAQQLSKFTGLPLEYIIKNQLRISTEQFRKRLLSDSSLSIGRYDGRLRMYEPNPTSDETQYDASFTGINGAFSTSINTYITNELNYQNELPYKVMGNVWPWDFGNGKYLNVTGELSKTIIQNPEMKVWVANGFFDLATCFAGTEYVVNHTLLPQNLQKNITMTYYNAGHMMYLHKPSLIKLKQDAMSFYKNQR